MARAASGLVESGQLKALAMTSLSPSAAMPGVPTRQAARVKRRDVDLLFWFAPKACPDAVKAKLEMATKVMTVAQVRERPANLDVTPDFAPAPVLRTRLENEITNRAKREGHQAGIHCTHALGGCSEGPS
jgi:tripartite-type tricarboxylate transporter receptor subunit TctC